VLGHHIGAPKELTYYGRCPSLLRHTGGALGPREGDADRQNEEGRDSVIVFVASEDSITHLEENRKNLAHLADPRGLSDADAQTLIANTKPIYTLSGGFTARSWGRRRC